jgi:hypothetical protein
MDKKSGERQTAAAAFKRSGKDLRDFRSRFPSKYERFRFSMKQWASGSFSNQYTTPEEGIPGPLILVSNPPLSDCSIVTMRYLPIEVRTRSKHLINHCQPLDETLNQAPAKAPRRACSLPAED